MNDQDKNNVEDIEIEPLSDTDLESVSGGSEGCSCSTTTSGCTGASLDSAV